MENWLLIFGMLVITFATRYSLFAFPDLRFPSLVRQGLHYVPTAVLTAIVVPMPSIVAEHPAFYHLGQTLAQIASRDRFAILIRRITYFFQVSKIQSDHPTGIVAAFTFAKLIGITNHAAEIHDHEGFVTVRQKARLFRQLGT